MAVRNCKDIGENLKKIMFRLLANDTLVKYLYYSDAEANEHNALTDEEKQEKIAHKLIRVKPKVTEEEVSKCIVAIRVTNGTKLTANDEFKRVGLGIEVFIPWEQWFVKDTNLRPFIILGEIQSSLDGKTVNGLGKLEGGDFALKYMTKEVICYEQTFNIVNYD